LFTRNEEMLDTVIAEIKKIEKKKKKKKK